MKSMKTVSLFSLGLLVFGMLACRDENLLPTNGKFVSKSSIIGNSLLSDSIVLLDTGSTSTVPDPTVGVIPDTIDIAVLLQKKEGATGTIMLELLDSHNQVIGTDTVSVNSIEKGIHWFSFRNIKPDSSLVGEKCKIRLRRSMNSRGSIFWVAGTARHDLYVGGVSSISSRVDFAFNVFYAQISPSFYSRQQQLLGSHSFILSECWTWQEVTLN